MRDGEAAAALVNREVYAREFVDPDAYTVANGLDASRVIGRPAANFRATVARVDLGRVKLRIGRATVPVTMVGGIGDVHAFTFATAPCAPRVLCGREVPFEHMLHLRPKEVMYGTSPSGRPWPYGTIALSYETMAAYGSALAGYAVSPRRDDTTLFRLRLPDLGRLTGLMMDAERLAVERPEVARHPTASQALAGAILDALVGCLTHGAPRTDRAATRHYARVIARFEQVLEERLEEMLSLADICAAIGVAERTLHHACQEFLGIGAMQYSRVRRMDRVRALLLLADPARDTVSQIAMRYGFWELGRFAGAYRARYGETPSATLRGAGRRLH